MAIDHNYQTALQDFSEARAKASMQEVLARLTGRSNELLSYDEVAEKLKLDVRSERGVQEIPLKAIVGSVGRYTDFTRSFLPRNESDRDRWVRVKAAFEAEVKLPPIDVYKVGDVYFVLDGNQRVSVARQEGFEFIQAHVIEVKTAVPLTADVQPDDLIVKAEYADFLGQTDILHLRPGIDLGVTVPGQYAKLLDHIQVHRYFMGIDFDREISYPDAVVHWYDTVYLPIIEPVRERGLLRSFPGRTETDMYLWVSEHRAALEKGWGVSISPEAALADLAPKEPLPVQRKALPAGGSRSVKLFDPSSDALFHDILVPLNGTPEGWLALEQAILVAQNEKAALHGLHVVSSDEGANGPQIQEIERQFSEICQKANVGEYLHDQLTVVKGSVPDQVCQRALLTDLVVLYVTRAWLPGLAQPGTGLRRIIWRSARPILAVPGNVSRMDRALLAFDGSIKSKEALFVAAYLAERWSTALTVLTLSDGGRISTSAQDFARDYLQLHEIQADFVVQDGPLAAMLDVIKQREINLVLMGGYSGTALKEVVLGTAVNMLLEKADCPLLICR